MTIEERIAAVARLGFTERQSRFLVHVMLFSGICLPRQYARFAGTAYGHNVNEFFAKLVRDEHATAWASMHNRGRLYHVSGKGVYDAIAEPRHPHRRPIPARQVVERLMRLDAVIAESKVRWLMSESERVKYVQSIAPNVCMETPANEIRGSQPSRDGLFPKEVLIGAGEAGTRLVYVVTSLLAEDWRPDLVRCGDLLAGLPSWRFRAYFPPDFKPWMSRFHFAFADAFASPSPNAVSDHLARQTGRVHCLLLPVAYRYAVPLLGIPALRRHAVQELSKGLTAGATRPLVIATTSPRAVSGLL